MGGAYTDTKTKWGREAPAPGQGGNNHLKPHNGHVFDLAIFTIKNMVDIWLS
jgi:hypothetical protein